MHDVYNRRAFLRALTAAGVAWAAADAAQIEEALAWATHQVETGGAGGLSVFKTAYADGVANLNRRASRAKVATFAALTPLQQDELLHAIEKTPFFKAVRLDTIVGTFALPAWGGNRDYAGWHLLGFEHQPRFQPPFGYYDAEINRRS